MDWLNETRGKGLLWEESRLVAAELDSVFGDNLLQIGEWGSPELFLGSARTQTTTLVSGYTQEELSDDLSGHMPVREDSIDAVLLPHTLETVEDPHQLIREIDRMLRPDGHLIVLGFNSPGWWSLRQKLSDGGFLPGIDRFVGDHRLTDWLSLLGFKVVKTHYYHPAKLVDSMLAADQGAGHWDTRSDPGWWAKQLSNSPAERRGLLRRMRGWRHWRITAACYMMVARKDVAAITPLRKSRFMRPRLVGSLVNPSARNSARVVPLDRR